MSITEIEIRHAHFFCGLGGAARGFNHGQARVGNLRARFRCLGGIDNDPAAVRDFERLVGVPGTLLDLFSREQYCNFHGDEPPRSWCEATPDDIRQAFGNEPPHIVFLSPPCKGFSGLLSERASQSVKYQALNSLTLRGIFLLCEAFGDDPPELIIFENVPRIFARGRYLLDEISALLRHYGYAVAETEHNCGEIGGLAQSRKRFLLVARHAEKVPPFLYRPPKHSLKGVGEILEKLPMPGQGLGGAMHRIPALQWRTWLRLAFVEAGSDWRSLNRLKVENGVLKEYGIIPEQSLRSAAFGVLPWHEPSGAVIGESLPTNGRFPVADPRTFGHHRGVLGVRDWDQPSHTITGNGRPMTGAFSVADPRRAEDRGEYGQFGVKHWHEPSQAVTAQAAAGSGRFSVSDPRIQGKPRFNNVFRIVEWSKAAPAVAGPGGPAGGLAVADPRAETSYQGKGKYRVTKYDEPAGTVIAASTTGNGAFALADPRTGWPESAHQNKLAVQSWEKPSKTVTGSDRVGSGALCIADPRCNGYSPNSHRNKLKVTDWQEPSNTVTGGKHVQSGALSVADPRWRDEKETYLTQGYYGVVPWDGSTGAVTAAGQHDNGRWSVADPRNAVGDETPGLPQPTDRLVAVIRSLDNTWHRPFTTLELAAIQSLVEPEEFLELDGLSDAAWRERIGNAVPPDAAQAIASTMGRTLLMARSGTTFCLSSEPIWVRPLAIALSVPQQAVIDQLELLP